MKIRPPKVAEWIMKIIFPDDGRYTTTADIEEVYGEKINEHGLIKSYFWYWGQIIVAIRVILTKKTFWSIGMLNNYLKVAIRNLNKHKGYSLINISGLSLGVASIILILLYVQYEMSYDKNFDNSENIYRVISEIETSNETYTHASAPNALTQTVVETLPEVVTAARFEGNMTNWLVRYNDKVFIDDVLSVADPDFLKLFSFNFLKGDPNTALDDHRSIILTGNMAEKYFSDKEPIGEVLLVGDERTPYRVTGVIQNLTQNTHLRFDCILHIENSRDWWEQDLESWKKLRFSTYLKLNDTADITGVQSKITALVKDNYPEFSKRLFLQPLDEVHLHSDFKYDYDNSNKGSMKVVNIFSITAFCILIMACFNYMNLSTARASVRAKEIGIRKTAGAHKKDIIIQFLGESILLSFIALIFAIVLVYFFLPVFNDLSGKQLSFEFVENPFIFFAAITLALITGIISGGYAAFILSSYKPIQTIKRLNSESNRGKYFRRALVTCQFVVTIFLIISTLVIFEQMQYMSNKDLGFDRSNIITFASRGDFRNNFDSAKNELMQNPNILSVTASQPPVGYFEPSSDFNWEGKDPDDQIIIYRCWGDYDYLKTFKLEMMEGRFFSKEFSGDAKNYVINEAAAKELGFDSPIGKRFSFRGSEGIIIGVIKDFHQGSLHNEIAPIAFHYVSNWWAVCVKTSPQNTSETISFLENKWKKFVPNYPFEYKFLDESLNEFYSTENKTGKIINYFTYIAVFISCLGLFGLASFMSEQKAKEFGIRKVLGAKISVIIWIQFREIIIWISTASIITIPISWFVMNEWLQAFAYRINFGLKVFIISGILICSIALFSVLYQSLRSAFANPVDSLRIE